MIINGSNFAQLLTALTAKQFVYVHLNDEIVKKANETAENIINRKYDGRGKRSEQQIRHDCLLGTIREAGIAALTNGTINNQEMIHTRRETYAWDVKSFGFKLEVKPQTRGSKNFNFSEYVYKILINNARAQLFDFIVTCDVIEEPLHNSNDVVYKVYPMSLIDRNSFNTHCIKSQYQGMYYPEKSPQIKLN